MTRILILAAVLSGSSLFAQDDDTIQFRQGLPLTTEDSTEYDRLVETYPPDGYEPISADEVPEKVRKTLDGDDLYDGWRNAKIFFNDAAQLYWVDFRLKDKIRRFGFNADGAPVSVKEQDIDD